MLWNLSFVVSMASCMIGSKVFFLYVDLVVAIQIQINKISILYYPDG